MEKYHDVRMSRQITSHFYIRITHWLELIEINGITAWIDEADCIKALDSY